MAGSVSERLYGVPGAPWLRRAWNYAQLMRLDRPIGIFLLLWPTLVGAVDCQRRQLPPLKLLLVFVAGTIVMRSAGCVINDFADRDIDPQGQAHPAASAGRAARLALRSPGAVRRAGAAGVLAGHAPGQAHGLFLVHRRGADGFAIPS